MARTYAYFILILTAWGLWGFFGKYALRFIRPSSLVLYEVIGSLAMQVIVLAYLLNSRKDFDKHSVGMSIAIISGFISILGVIIFYLALSNTKASVLVPLTALYPVVTVLLSFIF